MHQLSANEQAAAVWDETLIARYDLAGPRYTSYPTAPQFHRGFGAADLRRSIEVSNARGNPLSLYFHRRYIFPEPQGDGLLQRRHRPG